MSMTMSQVATQLQQVLFTLRTQVAAESGLGDAMRAINNLATAQVRKDTPSLIDVKGLGRPKELSDKAEDSSTVVEEDGCSLAGVINDSGMMFEWAAEQTTDITTELVDREFLPTATNQERGAQKPGVCCSRCTQHLWLSRVMR